MLEAYWVDGAQAAIGRSKVGDVASEKLEVT